VAAFCLVKFRRPALFRVTSGRICGCTSVMTKTTKHAINNSPSTTMKRKTMIRIEKLPPTLLSVRFLEAIQ
jgi:hypothetical protein